MKFTPSRHRNGVTCSPSRSLDYSGSRRICAAWRYRPRWRMWIATAPGSHLTETLRPSCPSLENRICVSPKIGRSEEHTSELQSLMRISYAVFCLKKKNNQRYDKLKNNYSIY